MELDALERILSDRSLKPIDIDFSALQSITRNFSEERIIGAGGFARVYQVNFTFQSFFLDLNNQNISHC
jgi:hypothetical protein